MKHVESLYRDRQGGRITIAQRDAGDIQQTLPKPRNQTSRMLKRQASEDGPQDAAALPFLRPSVNPDSCFPLSLLTTILLPPATHKKDAGK